MHALQLGGKAILAHLPEVAVDDVLDRIGEQGYALNRGEDLAGIHAVAVPLLFEGTVLCALSVAGPAHRVTRERCESELALAYGRGE